MEVGSHRGMMANKHIRIGTNSHEKVKTFQYFESLLTNENSIQVEIKYRPKAENSFYYSVQIGETEYGCKNFPLMAHCTAITAVSNDQSL